MLLKCKDLLAISNLSTRTFEGPASYFRERPVLVFQQNQNVPTQTGYRYSQLFYAIL